MAGSGVKGAVPAAVVLAMLSTLAGVVTTMAVKGEAARQPEALRYYMPRDELERRLGQLERRIDLKFYDLRELIIRRVSK
jgi:hypothetical protein